MKPSQRFGALLFLFVIATSPDSNVFAEDNELAYDLVGLWEAHKSFAPRFEGKLIVTKQAGRWSAEIAGTRVAGEALDSKVVFKFPGGENVLLGGGEALSLRLDDDGNIINGQWTQQFTFIVGMANNSPLEFERVEQNRWSSEVVPMENGFTFFLVVTKSSDGTLNTFLRNPERNLGIFTNLKRVEQNGNQLEFIGTFLRRETEQVFYRGEYSPDRDKFTIDISNRGGSYDFYRVAGGASNFYARSKNPPAYRYSQPIKIEDGWQVGSLDEAGISFGPIRDMVEKEIDPPAASVDDLYVHGLLIARHGKLVFEDYFHGYHRDRPHDTRSASKSLTSVLTGAVIEAGYPVAPSMPVYESIHADDLPRDLDPRKYRITLEHLLTMSSGFYCDDRDPDAPGNEDVMQSQEKDNDWYHYTLALPMALEPGEQAIYCSINPNLIGKLLIERAGQPLEDLFQDLIAEPLQLGRYYLQLQPTGEPYMGGGIYWLPRDFMKLGQLLVNKGTWNGKRIVSEKWVERSTYPHFELRDRQYGYLWWIHDYPHKGSTVRAFLAAGNGGQVIIGIPELDLVINFWGGNYSSRTLYRMSGDLITDYILPAVDATRLSRHETQ